jgi:serine/threonine protein kinase
MIIVMLVLCMLTAVSADSHHTHPLPFQHMVSSWPPSQRPTITHLPKPPLLHLPQESVLLRARDVASGMTYLHSRQVCHGDLKCENVLVKSDPSDPDGLVAKVADFGLSRALAAGQVRRPRCGSTEGVVFGVGCFCRPVHDVPHPVS